eukprot:11157812-Lingulodinium_polyedra.AAC.1
MHAVSGLVVVCQQLGLVRKRSTNEDGQPQLALGPQGSKYALLSERQSAGAVKYANAVIATARAARPVLQQWPDAASRCEFASELASWASAARRIRCDGVGL